MLSAQANDTTNSSAMLYIALDLSGKNWKIKINDGLHDRPSIYNPNAEQPGRRFGETVAKIVAQQHCDSGQFKYHFAAREYLMGGIHRDAYFLA